MAVAASIYATDHIYLVGFLLCRGHEILRTESRGARVVFVFDATQQLSADIAGFMGGATVAARQFSFEILKLKRQLPRAGQTVNKVSENAAENQHCPTATI
jgi:hypothetical protein